MVSINGSSFGSTAALPFSTSVLEAPETLFSSLGWALLTFGSKDLCWL